MTLTADRLEAYFADPVLLIAEQLHLPTGAPFGDSMAAFQRRFFEAIFAAHKDGRPLHRLVYDERRRGESKTEDMAAVGVADLLVGPPGHRSYAVAGDQDQAELILDSIRGFRARSALLADIEIQRSTVINQVTGSRLVVMSSDSPTSYGLRARRIYFDELSLQPDDRLWTSMWTAIGKSPYSQMVTVSMAGWDFSGLAWRIRQQAASNPAYYFASREGSELAPWLSDRDMQEQRETLHPADFARFWDCRWTEPKGSWISREMYEACETGHESFRGHPGHRYAGFVDLGLVRDATAIAVCHRPRGEDRIVLDKMVTFQGSRARAVDLESVEHVVADLSGLFKVQRWIFEAPQAVASVQRLQRRLLGVSVEARYPTVDIQGRIFGTLYRLIANRQLVLYPHEQLRKEALSLVTKTSGGRLKVVEGTSIHQDHVVALAGACDLLIEQPSMDPESIKKITELTNEIRYSGRRVDSMTGIWMAPVGKYRDLG
jgi:hypothetical protein